MSSMVSATTNNPANIAQNALGKNSTLQSIAQERLSTGLRINGADDDAAGLQIATRLNANVTGMETANRNIADATSMLQTADGALDELSTIANRMKELTTQVANGTNSQKDRTALDTEFKELAKEMERIVKETSFAGNKLFTRLDKAADGGGVSFQIGAGETEKLAVGIDTVALKEAIAKLQEGMQDAAHPEVQAKAQVSTPEKTDYVAAVDAVDAAIGTATIGSIDTIIDTIGTQRSTLGANINRLGHTASNLASVTENTKAAVGRIMDTDFAVETSNLTKASLLVSAGTSMLSKAGQLPLQTVTTLLRGV